MIVILTGSVGSGKTSFLRRLLSYLGSEDIAVAGFIGQRVFVEDELVGYDLIDAASLRRHTFLRKGEGPADEMVGPYRIDPAGKEAAAAILRNSPAFGLAGRGRARPARACGRGALAGPQAAVGRPRAALPLRHPGYLPGGLRQGFRGAPDGDLLRARPHQLGRGRARDPMPCPSELGSSPPSGSCSSPRSATYRPEEAATVGALIERLGDTPARRPELFEGRSLKPHLVVMINGAPVPPSGFADAAQGRRRRLDLPPDGRGMSRCAGPPACVAAGLPVS